MVKYKYVVTSHNLVRDIIKLHPIQSTPGNFLVDYEGGQCLGHCKNMFNDCRMAVLYAIAQECKGLAASLKAQTERQVTALKYIQKNLEKLIELDNK